MARPHPSRSGSTRGDLYARPSATLNSPINRCRRSWTDNGVHYTMETASYTSPGLSFSASGGAASGLLGSFLKPDERAQRRQAPAIGGLGSGLLGTAVNLLGAMSDMRDARRAHTFTGSHQSRHVEVDELDEWSDDDEDLAYGNAGEASSSRPRSMFSRLKEKLVEKGSRAQQPQYSREVSPARRPRSQRQTSYGTEVREPSESDFEEDSDLEDFDNRRERPRARRTNSDHANRRHALEQTVGHYQTQVRRSRRNLERASRLHNVDIGHLQILLNEVKNSERSLARAEADLQAYGKGVSNPSRRRQPSRQAGPPPRRHTTGPASNDFDDLFTGTGCGMFTGHPGSAHPLFTEPDELHSMDPFAHLFGGVRGPFMPFGAASLLDDDLNRFFAMPGGAPFTTGHPKRPRFATTSSSPPPRATPSFLTFSAPAPSRPPPTLMKPPEAKQLFTAYNERWDALSHSDSNIPYPARGLHAPALLARDTLWAPNVSSHPATWSDEAVMQANTQAFFLNVVDMLPKYSEVPGTGRVEMGFEKGRATPAQVKQLIEMLKKEKGRWHSDRLGRRNHGRSGPNQALQTDERARAVFHAVCELMETAQ